MKHNRNCDQGNPEKKINFFEDFLFLYLEKLCGCVLGPWPWPRIFFVSLALASTLVSSTPPLLLILIFIKSFIYDKIYKYTFRLVLRCLLVAKKENSTGFSTGLTGRSKNLDPTGNPTGRSTRPVPVDPIGSISACNAVGSHDLKLSKLLIPTLHINSFKVSCLIVASLPDYK